MVEENKERERERRKRERELFSSLIFYHTDYLSQFCNKCNLCPAVQHETSIVDFTYHFNMCRFSILDHFIVSSKLFDRSVMSLPCLHDIDNLSDD